MSIMKKSIATGFAVLAFSAASAAYASDAEVVAMHITFITKSNSNAQDPNLDVKIYNKQHELVAENNPVPGTWENGSINSISLDLKKPFNQSDISGGSVELDIHPAASQTWKFDYNISTTYSDNSLAWQRWNGKELSKDKPTLSDNLTGQ